MVLNTSKCNRLTPLHFKGLIIYCKYCFVIVSLHPMQVSWLSVLSSVTPHSLCRKAATDNMLKIIKAHPGWPVHADDFEHPPPWLASRRPIWSDMAPVYTTTQWREDWSSASVLNHSIVTDPII